MNFLRGVYWRLRIVWMSLRWIPRPNLRDRVIYDGREWTLTQGVKSPIWTLRRGDYSAFPSDAESAFVHENDFEKVRSLANYLGSFRSGYRFYMGYWFAIWRRGWRLGK